MNVCLGGGPLRRHFPSLGAHPTPTFVDLRQTLYLILSSTCVCGGGLCAERDASLFCAEQMPR